jgi:hypothetical protein
MLQDRRSWRVLKSRCVAEQQHRSGNEVCCDAVTDANPQTRAQVQATIGDVPRAQYAWRAADVHQTMGHIGDSSSAPGAVRSVMWMNRSTGLEDCHQHDGAAQVERIVQAHSRRAPPRAPANRQCHWRACISRRLTLGRNHCFGQCTILRCRGRLQFPHRRLVRRWRQTVCRLR